MTAKHTITTQPFFDLLTPSIQVFLLEKAELHHLSLQDSRQLTEIVMDLQMWGAGSIKDIWPDESNISAIGKAKKKKIMLLIQAYWQQLKIDNNHYLENSDVTKVSSAIEPLAIKKEKLGLGRCPVASPRTLCCNLQTLDAVDNCGYGCSYCSIQSFFDGKQISFDNNFSEKLKNLELDPNKTYHIGTGQSSDSLMWGNSHAVLDGVIDFALNNPNVILELKTKSANVNHLIRSNAPKNIICTWSLNTPVLIEHEEHGTATLEKRLAAARKVADAGFIVGFHFHPIIHYDNWMEDYKMVIDKVCQLFTPDEVALISFGTLTYIKSVIKEIRKRGIPTQILKMPMVDADGKQSYPDDIKLSIFSHLYQCFPDSWKNEVFYYLCMENQRFWKPVFGFEYASNSEFESVMKKAYMDKINTRL